jgi:D-glycero-D-manno-heptose 1,7-bisphosphate phosphatase
MSGQACLELLNAASVVIFDADNTLRRTVVPDQPCPHGPDEWVLMPNVVDVLRGVAWERVRCAVASNQDHVGYGLLSRDTALALLQQLVAAATDGRARDPVIRFCAHRLEDRCDCRKPAPGLLLDVLATLRVEPTDAVFVGDDPVDRAAARAAGVRFVWAAELFGWR